MGGWSVDSERVRELEVELDGIRSAFQDYIANSRDLETGLDHELGNMHQKLDSSASANQTLASQLESMEPLIQSLEQSLGKSKKKLKQETRLRKQLEKEREQWASRERVPPSSREEFDSMRENDVVVRDGVDGIRKKWNGFSSPHQPIMKKGEKRVRERSILSDDARRSDIDTISASNFTKDSSKLDDSYQEVLDELETVTEQLISTQQKLWKTEDRLRDTEVHVQELEDQQTVTSTDKILRAKVAALERELALAHEKTRLATDSHMEKSAKETLVNFDLQAKLQNQLDQTKGENALLLEEIASRRNRCSNDTQLRASNANEALESRDHELVTLRGQLDEISEQNGILQQRIVHIEGQKANALKEGEEMFELREQIDRLQYEFSAATDQNRITLLENDASWREKLEIFREDSKTDLLAMQRTSDGKDEIVEGLQQQIHTLCRKRDALEAKVANLESTMAMTNGKEIRDRGSREELNKMVRACQRSNSALEQQVDELTIKIQCSSALVQKMEKEREEILSDIKSACSLIGYTAVQDQSHNPVENMNLKDSIHMLCLRLKSSESSKEGERLDSDTSNLTDRITHMKIELESSSEDLLNLSGRLKDKTGKADAAKTLERETGVQILENELRLCRSSLAKARTVGKLLNELLVSAKNQPQEARRDEYPNEASAKLISPSTRNSHNPRARDPEPDQRIFDEGKKQQNFQQIFSAPLPGAGYRKDPPSTKQNRLKNELLPFVDCDADHLEDIALENKLLKERILEMDRATKADNTDLMNESLQQLQQQIKAIQSSPNDGKVEQELAEAKQLLVTRSKELQCCETMIARSTLEADTLQEKMVQIKDALKKEQISKVRIKKEFEAEVVKLKEQCSCLQNQLEEKKKSFAFAQKERDRLIQGVTTSEDKLGAAQIEIYSLQNEVTDLIHANSKLTQDYNGALKHAEEREHLNRLEVSGFGNQLKKLADDNTTLHRESDDKSQRVHFLTEKVSDLNYELEKMKAKYNGVVDDLEAVSELFDQARREAEESGRASAAEDLRAQMRTCQETERKEIHDKVEKVFMENRKLLAQLEEAKQSSSFISTTRLRNLAEYKDEHELLQEAFETLTNKNETLREREHRLASDLDIVKGELRAKKEELMIASSSIEQLEEELKQRKASTSTITSAPAIEMVNHKMLQARIRDLVSGLGVEGDSKCTRKVEELQLKVELLDIGASLGKIERENAILGKELKDAKKLLSESCISAELKGRREATKEIWGEIKESREREMNEFREQFSSLVRENIQIEKKMRDNSIALKRAQDACTREEVKLIQVHEEAQVSKVEAGKLEQEILQLKLEVEAARDEQELYVDEAKSALRKEWGAKVMALHQKICDLTCDNSSLRRNLKNARKEEAVTIQEVQALMMSLNSSHHAIDEIKDQRDHLDAKAKATESTSENLNKELQSKLVSASNELGELSFKVLNLNSALDERTKELVHMQRKYGRSSKHGNANGSHLVEVLQKENSLLKKQLDDAQIELSLSKCDIEELKKTKLELESLKESSGRNQLALKGIEDELAQTREENAEATKTISVVNELLDSIEGVSRESPMRIATTSREITEGIEMKLYRVCSILQAARNDSVSQVDRNTECEKLQMQLKISNENYDQSRKGASHWQSKVTSLLEELDTTKYDLATLQKEMENLSSRVVEMCIEAEERGKEVARREVQDMHREVSPDMQSSLEQKNISDNEEVPKELVQLNRHIMLALGSGVLPEARYAQDSDIFSEMPSMDDDMEETDHVSDLQIELQRLQEQFEKLPEQAEILEELVESQERPGNEISKPQRVQLSEYGLMLDTN